MDGTRAASARVSPLLGGAVEEQEEAAEREQLLSEGVLDGLSHLSVTEVL